MATISNILKPIQSKVFASEALPSDINQLPVNPTAQVEQASQAKGFPHETMIPIASGGVNPRGQDFNGQLNYLSEQVRRSAAGLSSFWTLAERDILGGYPVGAVVSSPTDSSLASLYYSLTNHNLATPGTDSAKWLPVGGQALLDLIPSSTFDEAAKWELYPMGAIVEVAVGALFGANSNISTWLADHPKWKRLDQWTGVVVPGTTGTQTIGRVNAVGVLPVEGSVASKLLSHRHTNPATSHAHQHDDGYFAESLARMPAGAFSLPAPGTKGHDGNVDNDNVIWAVKRTTDQAIIPATVTELTGSSPTGRDNMQPTYYSYKVVKVLP